MIVAAAGSSAGSVGGCCRGAVPLDPAHAPANSEEAAAVPVVDAMAHRVRPSADARSRDRLDAYVGQQAVETYGWLRPGEMLDGLGMAETTPGPLIMVLQFVGYMGAYRLAGGLDPLLAGILGPPRRQLLLCSGDN